MLNITTQENPKQVNLYELRFNIQKNELLPYNYTIIKKFKNKNIIEKKDIEEMFINDLSFLRNYQLYYNFKNFNNLKLEHELPNNYLVDVLSRNNIININGEEESVNKSILGAVLILFIIILLILNFYIKLDIDLININKKGLFIDNLRLLNNYLFTSFISINFIFSIFFLSIILILFYLNFISNNLLLSMTYYSNCFKKILLFKNYFYNEINLIRSDFLSKLIYSLLIFFISIYLHINKKKSIKVHYIFYILILMIPNLYLINITNKLYYKENILVRPYDIFSLIINVFALFGLFFYQYINNDLLIYTIIVNNIFHIGILFLTIFQFTIEKSLVNIEVLDLINNSLTFVLILVYLYKNIELLPQLLSVKKTIFMKKIDFIGYLVHELKTPLMNIRSKSDMILDNKVMKEETIESNVKSIIKSSNILKSLIQDFLMFSKSNISVTKARIQKIRIEDLKKELEITINNLNPQISIHYDINTNIINGDRLKITQIIINFITNAIKYSNVSDITLIIKDNIYNNIYIAIRDEGIGISYKRLFNLVLPFSRQRDNFYEEKRKGDGLGLYISKEFINYMNGLFYIKTAENKGSEFGFYIPNIEVQENNSIFILDTEDKNIKILIYDDDKTMREIYKHFLHKFNITIAESEHQVLSLIEENHYDLLIIDYYLQGITGIDVINKLKKFDKNQSTKTLLVTGYDDLLLAENELVNDILTKPFSKKELLQKIIKLNTNDLF